jgi:hypothetical protein
MRGGRVDKEDERRVPLRGMHSFCCRLGLDAATRGEHGTVPAARFLGPRGVDGWGETERDLPIDGGRLELGGYLGLQLCLVFSHMAGMWRRSWPCEGGYSCFGRSVGTPPWEEEDEHGMLQLMADLVYVGCQKTDWRAGPPTLERDCRHRHHLAHLSVGLVGRSCWSVLPV